MTLKQISLGIVLLFASSVAWGASLPFPIIPGNPSWDAWVETIEKGNLKLERGNYQGAYEDFSAAEKMDFSPIASFLTWINLGEALCLKGERNKGLEYLLDYEEAARLIINKNDCFLSAEDYDINTYNPTIRSRAAKLLCPEEVFLEAGPTGSRETDLAASQQMMGEAQRIRKICEAR